MRFGITACALIIIVMIFSIVTMPVTTQVNTDMNQVVQLGIGDHVCTGFVVKKNLLMTARHCVVIPGPRIVYFQDGAQTPFTVVQHGIAEKQDWALITAYTRDIIPLHIRTTPPLHTGELISHVGYAGDPFQRVKYGFIARIAHSRISVVGKAIGGNSGSPIFDEFGNVVGIVTETMSPILFMLGYPITTVLEQLGPLDAR